MSFKFTFLLCLLYCVECLADYSLKGSAVGVTVINDVCKLKPSYLCWANFVKYYFDPSCMCCKQYVYGGCFGNGNMFDTASELLDDTCKLNLDSGSCSEHITRYYFDPSCMCCKEFVSGGYLGNGNNFHTNEECIMKCIGHIVTK